MTGIVYIPTALDPARLLTPALGWAPLLVRPGPMGWAVVDHARGADVGVAVWWQGVLVDAAWDRCRRAALRLRPEVQGRPHVEALGVAPDRRQEPGPYDDPARFLFPLERSLRQLGAELVGRGALERVVLLVRTPAGRIVEPDHDPDMVRG